MEQFLKVTNIDTNFIKWYSISNVISIDKDKNGTVWVLTNYVNPDSGYSGFHSNMEYDPKRYSFEFTNEIEL